MARGPHFSDSEEPRPDPLLRSRTTPSIQAVVTGSGDSQDGSRRIVSARRRPAPQGRLGGIYTAPECVDPYVLLVPERYPEYNALQLQRRFSMAAVDGSGALSAGQSGATDRLDSWKEIAAYLRRSERTVRRWEHTLHLPVHRLSASKRANVFALKSELDNWAKCAQGENAPPSGGGS